MITSITKNKHGESGIVLVICLILLLMLSLVGISSLTTTNSDMKVAENEMNQMEAFYNAEAGLEEAAASIIASYQTTGAPPSPLPSGTVNNGDRRYTFSTVDLGPASQQTLNVGAYRGLYGLVKSFAVTSDGWDVTGQSAVRLHVDIQDALIPLFQFAIFYQNDLEIAPGANMTLGGRVHSNHDIYLQTGANLYINSYLSSAGDIYHGRHPSSGQSVDNGPVYIMDRSGAYQNMRNPDNSWLDSRSSDWVNASLARWGGLVEDNNHGITELYMPVVADGPPTDLIDRAPDNPDSYENDATLKFVDGQALYLRPNGTWEDITATLTTQGVITTRTFTDGRQGRTVTALDIDLTALANAHYFPSNGIIYAAVPSTSGSFPVVRLRNAAELAAPLTVATVNPLYTVGNYNTTNKKPAALIADAYTILSNNWSDARSSQSLSNRTATATQVNACYITGNVASGSGGGTSYSGGLENLPRFLENWSGVTFTWRGSAAALWNSRQATALWSYGSYYTAPNRNWAFDPDLLDINNLPPGTPMVNIVQKMNWRQEVLGLASSE